MMTILLPIKTDKVYMFNGMLFQNYQFSRVK